MSVSTADYPMVIGGTWTESESGERVEATSPATGLTNCMKANRTTSS